MVTSFVTAFITLRRWVLLNKLLMGKLNIMKINISEEMKQRLIKLCCRKNGAIHSNRDTKSFIKNNDAELYDYLCGVVDLSEYDDNIKEVILCIIHDIEYRPICPVCGKELI